MEAMRRGGLDLPPMGGEVGGPLNAPRRIFWRRCSASFLVN
jgi:hypothetical protein